MAQVTNFRYTIFKEPRRNRKPPVLGEATFRIRGEEDDAGEDDFKDALTEFKQEVPWELRRWDPGCAEWTVQITETTRRTLCELFENAQDLLEEVEQQLEFPWSRTAACR